MERKRKNLGMKLQLLIENKLMNNSAAIFLAVFFLIFSGFVIWLELKVGLVSNVWYNYF